MGSEAMLFETKFYLCHLVDVTLDESLNCSVLLWLICKVVGNASRLGLL